jgi:hypothetical protein
MAKVLVHNMSELKIADAPLAPDDSTTLVTNEAHSEPEEVGVQEAKRLLQRSLRRKRSNSENDSLLHSINQKNKSIKKRKNSTCQADLKTDKDVRKYYLNINKNIKVKPILLETIYEQFSDESIGDKSEQGGGGEDVKKLGKASKRTIKISNGFDISKSLITKRKKLIKKNMGSRKKPKKVALAKFIEEFKNKTESVDLSD